MTTITPKNHGITVEREAPFHPGKILLEAYLEPAGITQAELSRHLGVSPVMISDLIRGKRGINMRLALLLGEAFGNGPEIWYQMQANYDFCRERDELRRDSEAPHVKLLPALS